MTAMGHLRPFAAWSATGCRAPIADCRSHSERGGSTQARGRSGQHAGVHNGLKRKPAPKYPYFSEAAPHDIDCDSCEPLLVGVTRHAKFELNLRLARRKESLRGEAAQS